MWRKIFPLGLCLIPLSAFAALPPQHQNSRDLEQMLAFARQHPTVMTGIRAIDLEARQVRFGSGCVVQFARQAEPMPPRPGPAPPLVFSSANCPIGPASP